MHKERPILFNGDMVRALLDGRKTQTRRLVKTSQESGMKGPVVRGKNGAVSVVTFAAVAGLCPYGNPGDRLWVRETWGVVSHEFDSSGNRYVWKPDRPATPVNEMPFGQGYYHGHVIYAADGAFEWAGDDDGGGDTRSAWKPSIHMPRIASRLTLEIVNVRVERLKAISEADAKAEGVRFTDFGTFTPNGAASTDLGETWQPFKSVQHSGYHVGDVSKPSECHSSARGAFAGLWAAINGADSWNASPWVWVVEFKCVEASR